MAANEDEQDSTPLVDQCWTNVCHQWHHVVLASGRKLAGIDVDQTLTPVPFNWNQWLANRNIIWSAANVGPTDVQKLGQRWTTIYFYQNDVGPTIASNVVPSSLCYLGCDQCLVYRC